MSKKFAGQVVLLVLVNLFIKLIWIFGVEREVQLQVGFANYGLYYSLFNFSFILGVLTDPGLSNYLVRSLSVKASTIQHDTSLFLLKLGLSFIYLLIAIVIGVFVGYHGDAFKLLLILSVYQILWSFLVYLRAYLKAHQQFGYETFFSVFDKTLLIVVLIPLLYQKTNTAADIYFFAFSQVFAVFISIIICVLVLMNKGIFKFKLKDFKLDFHVFRKLAPFALFTFLVLAYNKIDTIMLEKMLVNGRQETGIYAAAYRLLDATNLLPILFATLFLPIMSKELALKKDIQKLLNASFEVLMSLSVVLSLACWFYKNEMMFWIYGSKSSAYLSQIFGFLMFSSPAIVLFYVFSTVLTAQNQLRTLNLIAFSGLLINVVFNLFLIPKYQAFGAAISTLISLFWVGFTYAFSVKNSVAFRFHPALIIQFLILISGLYLMGYILNFAHFSALLSLGIFMMAGIFLALLTGLISIKKLKENVKINQLEEMS